MFPRLGCGRVQSCQREGSQPLSVSLRRCKQTNLVLCSAVDHTQTVIHYTKTQTVIHYTKTQTVIHYTKTQTVIHYTTTQTVICYTKTQTVI